MLLFEDITVEAGHRTILQIPHLELGPGLVHLRGPVGSGKTTLLGLAATLVQPRTGRVEVAGHDAARDAIRVRRHVGYLGHEPAIAPELTVRDTLRLHARVHGLDAVAIDAACRRLGIERILERRGATLSRGQRALADLARATLHGPDVLLLDEPQTGLDDTGRAALDDAVEEHVSNGALVVVASHGPVRAPPDATVRLTDGRLADDGGPT